MDRWVLDRDRWLRLLSWCGLLWICRQRAAGAFIAGAELFRDAGAFHPVANEFGDVLMRFLFERGDEIVKIETSTPAGVEHMAEGLAENVLTVAILQRKKEEKALGANHIRVFGLSWSGLRRHSRQCVANRVRADSWTLNSLAARGSRVRGQRGERRILFEEARILAVAEPTGGQGGPGRGEDFWGARTEIDHDRIERSQFRGRFCAGLGKQLCVVGRRAAEAALYDRAFHQPQLIRLAAARTKHRIVGMDRGNQLSGRLAKCVSVLGSAAPGRDGFGCGRKLTGSVAPGDNERIAVFGLLGDAEGLFAMATRDFGFSTASVHQEALGDFERQQPSRRRNAPGSESSSSRKKLRTPTIGGQKERVGRKAESVFAGRRGLVFHRKVQRSITGNRPHLRKSQKRVTRIVWRGSERN